MEMWQHRGLMIANSHQVEKNILGYKVPSQSGNGTYIVNLDHNEPICTCNHFESTHKKCQHIYAVEFLMQREIKPDGTVTETTKVTYTQNWTIYDEVQMHEQEQFILLLRELCNGIEQPEYKFGRPRLPLSDVIFGIVYKVYSTMSGRRFMTDLREAEAKQLITKPPSFASIFGYLENPELTQLLKSLIEQSARPLREVESDFAVDSSGFSTSTYSRWFDHKYGKEKVQQSWIKTHLMCGVNTHIVTAVEAMLGYSSDTKQFPALVRETAKTFKINEVSADKAYSDRKNLWAVKDNGGTAYIPFKRFSKGKIYQSTFDGLWQQMWHFFTYNKEEFMRHYHKRSNAETVFSMIKAKFGGSVRSKTPIAQVNEVLCKILCHNICVLIQAILELGIEPTFSQDVEPQLNTPKALESFAS